MQWHVHRRESPAAAVARLHRQLGADERAQARLACGLVEARRAVHAVAIEQRHRVVARALLA